ncbi:LptF/LptG family permease [Flavobacterium sp.]|uniref:LptF/LptG family permease n=1 Tax=Flavobacterium sp. TaxID=239 RepID=UPI0037BFCC84
MKILDKYLLKSFLITFATVFVILFFIFILQVVWLFISELAGKGLDFIMIMKFLLFAMPRLIPLVLPLSVLLASIMTYGSLSENYEFAAIKSSGISFQRMLRSNTIFIIFLCLISFFFANNVIPYAEYKFINFRRNIAQIKPAMAIAEGQFSEIGNYTIKVKKKSGDKGNYLTGVTIHKKLDFGQGNTTVINAEKGELVSSETSNTLKLILTNGNYYEDIIPNNYTDRIKIPFAKGTFKKDVINIDLSKLNQTNAENFDINYDTGMLNINELRYSLDSLNKNYKKDLESYTDNIYLRTGINNNYYAPQTSIKLNKISGTDYLKNTSTIDKQEIYKIAINNMENIGFSISSSQVEMDAKLKNINNHWIAFFDKFKIAFSCILMFFIGAPLGSIIRKGGLGLPIVFAVAIFIGYHFINTFGIKLAEENQIIPFLGVFLSTLILTPLALFLSYRAINDIGGMVSFDGLLDPVKNTLLFKKINGLFSRQLTSEVQENYTKPNEIVFPIELIEKYNKTTKITLALYAISILVFLGVLILKSNLTLIFGVITIILFLFFVLKSQKLIAEIELKTNQYIEPGMFISLLIAFPFYILIYINNKKDISKLKSNSIL